MKLIIVLIFSFNFCFGQLPPDKLYHAMAGEAITAGTGYTVYHLSNNLKFGFYFGTLSGIAAGAGKEKIWDDILHKGHPDIWDFTATAFGSFKSGLTLIVEIDQEKKHNKKNNYLNFNNLK